MKKFNVNKKIDPKDFDTDSLTNSHSKLAPNLKTKTIMNDIHTKNKITIFNPLSTSL